ncbi:cytochrome c [uncultured Gimesia sp.]|uniref:cytochrome c n=1 Tax=uncultured Gimesia sp. TaxID=1678688 RepID=UPI002633FE61|nr:cytochrome c [uncultured Gimesia sp.]
MCVTRLFILVSLLGAGIESVACYGQDFQIESKTKIESEADRAQPRFRSLGRPGLHNVFQIDDQVYSGSVPEGKTSFEALKKMGIKTIISVDGTQPDLKQAKAAGMKYVHVPIGYDGISREAGLAFARAAKELKGPIYIHCHHGQHRGPAAAAMVGLCRGSLDQKRALLFLDQAGTSQDYAGLWRDVRQFQAPSPHEKLPELVESAQVTPMVTAMVQISHYFERLAKTNENNPQDKKEVLQALTLLREELHETARKQVDDYDETFKAWLNQSEGQVKRLEETFKNGNQKQFASELKILKSQCKRCHQAYRD